MTRHAYEVVGVDHAQLRMDELLRSADGGRATRSSLIHAAFAHHLRSNEAYREYARSLGVTVEGAERTKLEDIPLLPSSLFKRRDLNVASVESGKIVKQCSSSGTLGSRSLVPRDDDTLTLFLGSIAAAMPPFYGIERAGDYRAVVLGPSSEQAGDLWFSYVIACLSVTMDAQYFEHDGVFDSEAAVQHIRSVIADGMRVAIIGPPFRILEICELIARSGRWPDFPADSFVFSAGGWKGQQGKAIRPEVFRERVSEALRIRDPGRIRDCFNMVELNSVLHECEHHHKHLPPWVEAQSRDPKTGALLPEGEEGVLAFLDGSALSYPGFILSEDFGIVSSGTCACGRRGQVLTVTRRINRVEARGCALKMAAGGASHDDESLRFLRSIYRSPRDAR